MEYRARKRDVAHASWVPAAMGKRKRFLNPALPLTVVSFMD